MWSALRALEDKAELARRRSVAASSRGLATQVALFTAEEQAAQQHAAAIRAVLRLGGRTRSSPESAAEPMEAERLDADVGVERQVELDGTVSYSGSATRTR